jgi:hypothetical protein
MQPIIWSAFVHITRFGCIRPSSGVFCLAKIHKHPSIFLMVVVLSSHVVSTGLNCHHIMAGSVLLSSIAEGKCTKLKNTIVHYVRRTYPLKMM